MLFSRPDYDRIVDTEDLIPADEPVFLLRASDVLAPHMIETWAKLMEDRGADRNMVESARNHAAAMREYQKTHPPKLADMP